MDTVRMYLPMLGGPQDVLAEDVPAWEARGGYVLLPLSDAERDAALLVIAAANADVVNAEAAQRAADALTGRSLAEVSVVVASVVEAVPVEAVVVPTDAAEPRARK